MDTCRACLTQRKNLRSISQFNGDISYIEMINSIANVKVKSNDGYSNKICLSCCRRTQDAFEFKNLVEESQLKLIYLSNISEDLKTKKINFDNIEDVKVEMKCIKTDESPIKVEKPEWNIEFQNDCNVINYRNTTIKKCNEYIEKSIRPTQLSVEEFLDSIKQEDSNDDNGFADDRDFEYNNNDDEDDDYIPPAKTIAEFKKSNKSNSFRKTKSRVKKKVKRKGGNSVINELKKFKIKPEILEDIRLVPSKSKEMKPRGPRKNKKVHEKETICPYCGRICKNLKSHILLHTSEKTFKCDQCPKAFFTSKNLENHQITHTQEKQFKCNKCTAAFYQKAFLNSHLLSHAEVKKHVCEVCSKGFKRKCTLRRHVLRHSSANKTVMCELCNMSFFEKGQLRAHMRVHTGERPYNCEICSQPYSYKHDFNRHCIKKHGVFLKRRSVYVMNPEVLLRERALMKEVALRARGQLVDGKPINPFEGPQAALAYQQAIQALQNKQIPIDF